MKNLKTELFLVTKKITILFQDIYVTEGTQPLGFLRGRSSVKGNKNPLKNKETAMKLSKTRTTLQRNYLEDGSFTMVGRV